MNGVPRGTKKTPAWQKGQENCVIYRRRNAIPFNSYESPATGKYLRWFLSVTGENMRMRHLLFGAVGNILINGIGGNPGAYD